MAQLPIACGVYHTVKHTEENLQMALSAVHSPEYRQRLADIARESAFDYGVRPGLPLPKRWARPPQGSPATLEASERPAVDSLAQPARGVAAPPDLSPPPPGMPTEAGVQRLGR